MSGPALALIASVARNGSIGLGAQLVWDEPADKRWFRQTTMGCPVIMGRKTWDTLPVRFRPLPGRLNIVVTRQADWHAEGACVTHSLTEAVQAAKRQQPDAAKVFVIGGAQLYAEALPLAEWLVLTEIDAELPGDTHFPDWPRALFIERSRQAGHSVSPPHCAYAFVTYQRQA